MSRCVLGGILALLDTGYVEISAVHARQSLPDRPSPINLSKTDTLSGWPAIAVDLYGQVHVVWEENVVSGEGNAADTLYYTQLSDGAWLHPVDILAVPYGGFMRLDAFLATPNGSLALVWHGSSGLRVSSANVLDATSPRAWNSVSVEVGPIIQGADMVIDDAGVYHLVYVRNRRELIYRSSADGGLTWSEASSVGGVLDDDRAVDWPCIAAARDGTIFISWSENGEGEGWGPIGVWVARSTNGGANWDDAIPVVSGSGYTQSDLLVDDTQRVHLFWVGNLQVGGRYHRWSDDNGKTWSVVQTVAGPDSIRGMAGPGQLLQDSLGRIHVIVAGLGRETEAIWHGTWDNEQWSQLTAISGGLPDSQGSAAAIECGHRIHAVWIEYHSQDIWYTSFDTASPRQQTEPKPPAPPIVRAKVTDQETGNEPPVALESAIEPVSSPADSDNRLLSSVSPFLMGALPAAALVLGVMVYGAWAGKCGIVHRRG